MREFQSGNDFLEKAVGLFLVFLAGIAFGYFWAVQAYGVLQGGAI